MILRKVIDYRKFLFSQVFAYFAVFAILASFVITIIIACLGSQERYETVPENT